MLTQDIEALLCHSAVGALAINARQNVTFWNQEAQRLTGYSANEVLGRPCWEVLAGRDEKGHRFCRQGCQKLLRAQGGGRSLSPCNVLTRTMDGREFWINIISLVLPSAREDSPTLFHLFQDIDPLKRSEQFARQVLNAATKLQAEPKNIPSIEDMYASDLTAREQQVLQLLSQGADTATIAEKLVISRATVRNHIQHILAKMGVHSRFEAALAMFPHSGFLP